MDDTELFSRPQRFARVDNLVIILRGLPGSGKSSIAKNIQKIEAKFDKKTKIFTWDEYFEEVSSDESSTPKFEAQMLSYLYSTMKIMMVVQ